MSRLRPFLCSPQDFPTDLPPLLRHVYARRLPRAHGWEKRLSALLPAQELADIDRAVARLQQAWQQQEPVLIYGDYDVDGACATALMVRVLRRLGLTVAWFIPDRARHGYGLSAAGVAAARVYHPNVRLWVTVDNGMKSHAMAQALAEHGIELIITDHHLPEDAQAPLPSAVAVVNPNRADCRFASKALCGTGVAFYVLWALQQHLQQQALWPSALKLTEYLDLVALATIADVMPMDENNRILVHHGLRLLRRGQGNMGIKALLAQANVVAHAVSTQDMAFLVAPRLNAAGRMAHMKEGLQLLLNDEWVGAQDVAHQLDEYNRARKTVENDLLLAAKRQVQQAEQQALAWALLPAGNEGLLGILAGRLKALYQRPSLVACVAQEEGWVKASLRSCTGVALDQLLSVAQLQLPADDLSFGGHALAAGLTIRQSALPQLMAILNQQLLQDFPQGYPVDVRWHDGALSPEYFTVAWAQCLDLLEPWGNAFPAPIFHNVFEVLDERAVGGQHHRLTLRNPDDGKVYQAMWFFAEQHLPVGTFMALDYQLAVNRFHGDERLLLHIQAAEQVALKRLG